MLQKGQRFPISPAKQQRRKTGRTISTSKDSHTKKNNNNFDGNQTDFASKVAVPPARPADAVATQFAVQAKPLMMALNIPTYVNLYGYGYRNVYELHELVNVNDPRMSFEGSIVEQKSSPAAPAAAK